MEGGGSWAGHSWGGRARLLLAFGVTCLLANSSCDGGDEGKGKPVPPEELSDEELWAPLYGEVDDASTSLRLRFQRLDALSTNSGTDLAFLPHDGDPRTSEMLITTRDGRLVLVSLEEGEAQVVKDYPFQEEMSLQDACAPTNVLLDPEFETNSFLYVTYCRDLNTTQLVRYTWEREAGLSAPSVIFQTTREEATEGWHRFGSMGFEPDGTLWMTVGDHEVSEEAQNLASPLGSIVRIIPNRESDGEGHTFPEGNWRDRADAPEGLHPAVYVKGFRSPWRASRDQAGRFFVGDVGDHSVEEFNVVTEVGQNFGWATHEGPCIEDCDAFLDPSAFYDFDDEHSFITEEPEASGAEKRAIWVSDVYEDPARDRYQGLLTGRVLFGDLFTGAIRAVQVTDESMSPPTLEQEPVGALLFVTTLKVGPDGYFYALDLGGQLHVALLGSD